MIQQPAQRYFKVLLTFPDLPSSQIWVRHIPAATWQEAAEKALRQYPLGFTKRVKPDVPKGVNHGAARAEGPIS